MARIISQFLSLFGYSAVVCQFLLLLLHHTGSAKLSSSSESSVELLTWGKDTIIHRGRKDIHLSHYSPQNSVVVLIVNDVPWTQSDLRNLSGEFTVHAPSGQGLMAVVQVLYLRSNPTDDGCKDFLQFYDPRSAIGSSKICGKLSKENKRFIPDDTIGPRVFHSPSGMMQVQYKSDKGDPSFPSTMSDMSFHMVEIVFTSYKDCQPVGNERTEDVSKCGDKCISSILFCDERINCGFEEDFALDETNCNGEENGLYSTLGGSSFLPSLYLGAGLFLLVLVLVAAYHHQRAYRRIQNIPHK